MRSKRRRSNSGVESSSSTSSILECPQSLDSSEAGDVQLMLARFLSCICQSGDYRIIAKENESLSDLAKALGFRRLKLECVFFNCGLIQARGCWNVHFRITFTRMLNPHVTVEESLCISVVIKVYRLTNVSRSILLCYGFS